MIVKIVKTNHNKFGSKKLKRKVHHHSISTHFEVLRVAVRNYHYNVGVIDECLRSREHSGVSAKQEV